MTKDYVSTQIWWFAMEQQMEESHVLLSQTPKPHLPITKKKIKTIWKIKKC